MEKGFTYKEVQEVTSDLLSVATEEEKNLYAKLCQADEETILKEIGHSKDLSIMLLVYEWATRLKK